MDEEDWWQRFARWPLRDRLELLAFEAELARIPQQLIAAPWEAIDEAASRARQPVHRGDTGYA
jgi:hypothetical protein